MIETIAEALDHHQAGRRPQAEALYRQVLAEEPNEPTGLYLYGLFNFESGRVDAAAELFKGVVAARPDHAEGHVALANLRHWQDAHDAAIDSYRRALAVAPDHAGALLGLANALREQGDVPGAVQASSDAASRLPLEPGARVALGAALMAADQVEAAVDAYGAAVALAPGLVEAHTGLALALLQAGQNEAALTAADAALQLAPQSGEAWFLLGTALNTLGRPQEAVAALTRAAAINPQRAAIHLNLGNAYVELDLAQEAATSLCQALDIDPTLKEAHASLSSVYILAGESQAAEHHCHLALELDPDMVVAHQNLASILTAKGQMEKARWHRNQVYGRQNLFVERAIKAERTVLVLTTAESGNVPHRELLPKDRFTRLNWVIEYATAEQMAVLPPYDAVFNAVGDADLAEPTRAPMEAFLKICPRRILNDPKRVALTSRSSLPKLFAGIENLCVPPVARIAAADLAREGLADCVAAAGLAAPVLVRPVGSHGGKGLVRADSMAELDGLEFLDGADLFVTAFEEFQSPDGWRRKYRMIFVDRKPYPYHLAISRHWLVHYESADMPEDAVRVAEERRFLEDPAAALGPKVMATIGEIGQRMDLDYCGLDFSVLPDGRVLVFEANATMLVHREHEDGPLAHKNTAVQAICAAFQALLQG